MKTTKNDKSQSLTQDQKEKLRALLSDIQKEKSKRK